MPYRDGGELGGTPLPHPGAPRRDRGGRGGSIVPRHTPGLTSLTAVSMSEGRAFACPLTSGGAVSAGGPHDGAAKCGRTRSAAGPYPRCPARAGAVFTRCFALPIEPYPQGRTPRRLP